MSIKLPLIWCVGGADSFARTALPELSVNLRTGQNLDCRVQHIATCVTAQNVEGVSFTEPVSLTTFDAQWRALLDDAVPDAISVGFLPSMEMAKACSVLLKRIKTDFPAVSVVFESISPQKSDVQVPSSADVQVSLLPFIDVVIINAEAFETLTNAAVWPCGWLIRGSNNDTGQVMYRLLSQNAAVGFSSSGVERNEDDVLSMALVCFMAHGYDIKDSVTLAKAYCAGEQKGWPTSLECFPKIVIQGRSISTSDLSFAAMDVEKMGLYPVVDTVAWLELVLAQGVNVAQLRIKNPDDPQLSDKIQQAILLGKKYNAQVFINDYWQQAIEFGAYGVHLGQEDLDVTDLARIQSAGLRLGISTHGYYEIARAQSIKPSYIALGHIFPTQTKDMPSQPQGLIRLAHYARLLKGHYPTVAIGGITAERLPLVAQTGVDSVAVVTAITKAESPDVTTRALMASLRLHKVENAK